MHLTQVPGEMFTLAMEARERERGVVGSTSDILGFIAAKLKASTELPFPERLQVHANVLLWTKATSV